MEAERGWQTPRAQATSLLAVSCIAWLGLFWVGVQCNMNLKLPPLTRAEPPLSQCADNALIQSSVAGGLSDDNVAHTAGVKIEEDAVKAFSALLLRAFSCRQLRLRSANDVGCPRRRSPVARDDSAPVGSDASRGCWRRSHRRSDCEHQYNEQCTHRPNETKISDSGRGGAWPEEKVL